MATRSEMLGRKTKRRVQKRGQVYGCFNPVSGLGTLTRKQILAESEKLVIKPGMKLVYDEELNLMVWR